MTASIRLPHPWVAAGADRVRFGVFRAPVPDLGLMRDEMQYLESAGFDSVFLPDHPMLFPDPWVSLAGVAHATTKIRLGALVSCVAYRHPAMLARAVADVDCLSNGRALLGLGSGDMPWEFDMLGLTYGSAPPRRELLEQTLRVMPSLLRGEPVTAEARGFVLRNAVLPAPAVQQPGVPIIVAGGSRGTLRLAAEHADALNIGPAAWAGGAYSTDDVADRFSVLDGLCTDFGRGSGSVLRTGFFGLSIASTSDDAQAVLNAIPPEFGEFFRGFFFAGTPDDTVHYLNNIIGSGYQYLVFFTADLFAGGRDMTDRLLADVLPRLQRDVRSEARVDA
jgi:alkanesulfonate monooxygenase SsuD/methylene tetrahydromethanopterin reductase-like flavin-dependent oxidoreductase (luciferase family)